MRRTLTYLFLLGLIIGIVVFSFRLSFKSPRPIEFGASFSPDYAQYLGFDPRTLFTRLLTDMPFKYIRLSAPWNTVQPENASSTFVDVEWYLDEAQKHGVAVTLVIGQKTPRWSECHVPAWAQKLSGKDYAMALNGYLTDVVGHFKKNPALEYWQVENEPDVQFGDCPQFNRALVAGEFALVKQLDPYHARLATDSGELSTWRTTAHLGDVFGTTVYRTIWNKYLGYVQYDYFIPPVFYRLKAFFNHLGPEAAMISELQAEPWIPSGSVLTTALSEQLRSMSPERLGQNVAFAQRIGFPRVYVWGVEWWYYVNDTLHDSRMIDAARLLFPKKQSGELTAAHLFDSIRLLLKKIRAISSVG